MDRSRPGLDKTLLHSMYSILKWECGIPLLLHSPVKKVWVLLAELLAS